MTAERQMVRCPVCGTQGQAGDFCEMGCGRLPAAAGAPAAPVSPARPVRAASAGNFAAWQAPLAEDETVSGGEGLDERLDAAETVRLPWPVPGFTPAEQVPPPARNPATPPADRGPVPPQAAMDLELERDLLCVFFENMSAVLRFRITARRRLESITLEMENPQLQQKLASRRLAAMEAGTAREIGVTVPGRDAGAEVWYLKVSYEVDGRKRVLEGEVSVLTLKPREAQVAAKNLSVTINNNITNGHASDINLSQHAAADLAHLAHAENPYEELRKIVQGGQRAWAQTSLDRGGPLEVLPPMPPGAATDRLTLELGGGRGRLHLRVGRTVTVGRARAQCEITLRPRPGASSQQELAPYMKLSRRHCHFEAQGERVAIVDGYQEGLQGVRPSTFGTFWNGKPVERKKLLEPGESGILSLAGVGGAFKEVSFRAKACKPCGPCAVCTRTDRAWCGDGRHACLLLARQGAQPEAYVALWGCFGLGAADPAFEGVTLFRERGGFAWRRGRRCGWLVPGTTVETEFGTLEIRAGDPEDGCQPRTA